MDGFACFFELTLFHLNQSFVGRDGSQKANFFCFKVLQDIFRLLDLPKLEVTMGEEKETESGMGFDFL